MGWEVGVGVPGEQQKGTWAQALTPDSVFPRGVILSSSELQFL